VVDLARFAAWIFRTLDGVNNNVLDTATLRDMQRVHWVDPDWRTTWGLAFEVRKPLAKPHSIATDPQTPNGTASNPTSGATMRSPGRARLRWFDTARSFD
jgi:hypothetical protein